jgi:hypothetical protein
VIENEIWPPSKPTLAILGVAVLALVTFAPSIGNGFVYDDVKIVVEQTQLHSLANFVDIITSPWWLEALYRPLTKLSFAVDWAISGGRPWYFHLVNVLLHGITAVLVFFLARRWIGVFGATVAAAVFAVHPVNVEAVASVVGRADVLATLFSVTAVLCYRWDGVLAEYDDRTWRRYASAFGTIAALVLGLASKESAFVVPGLLLLVDWLESRKPGWSFDVRFRAHAVLWVASVAMSLEWLWIRADIVGELAGDIPAPGLEGAGILGRVLAMSPVVLQYVRLFFMPIHLSADYSPNFLEVETALSPPAIAGFVVAAIGIVLAVGMKTRAPVVTLSLLWVAGALLIVSNVLVPTGVLLAERTLYLPAVGFALGAGCVAVAVGQARPNLIGGLVAVAVSLGVVRSAHRVPVFRNDQTFYPQLIADAPGSFRGQWLSGHLAYEAGNRSIGERLYRMALATYPLLPNMWEDYARRLLEDGKWGEAAGAFAIAYRLDSTRVFDAANAATNFVRIGSLDSARIYAESANRVNPLHPRVKGAFGEIAAAEGNLIEAMTFHRQAAWLDPDQPVYWYRAAMAAIAAEYCPTSVRAVQAVSELAGDFAGLARLRNALHEMGCED